VCVLVYAIEASAMAEQAEIIVQSNAMQDHIAVIHGRIEARKHSYLLMSVVTLLLLLLTVIYFLLTMVIFLEISVLIYW